MQPSERFTRPVGIEAEFSRLVGELRQERGIRSVFVTVPTHVLGARLLRVISTTRPIVNVRFVTFPDLAKSVSISALVSSKRIPLPPMADFLAARKAIQGTVRADGYFGPIKEFPGTPRAILTTLTDLKKAGIGPKDLRQAIGNGESRRKLLELAEIYEEVERLKEEAGYFDESDALTTAAEAATASTLLDDAAAIVLYGFSELNELEKRFFAACVEARPSYAFVPEDVTGYTTPLKDWIESIGIASAAAPPRNDAKDAAPPRNDAKDAAPPRTDTIGPAEPVPADVKIISAPGVSQEVEEIARQIVAFAEAGGSFSDAAVLLRNPEEYERTIRDVFTSAGIPHVFLNGAPFADTLAGRLIRLLLRIRLGDYPRPDLMEFLELAPLQPSLLRAFPAASAADWDRYSREAGIVEGRDHWRRIPDMRRRTQWRIDRESKKPVDGRDSVAIETFRRDLGSLSVLEKTLNVLLQRLEEIPGQGTIAELMGRLLRVLLSVSRLPEVDRGVVKTMAGIARESVADEVVSLQTFASLVDDLLQQRVAPKDVYRTGKVIVSSLTGAAGLRFRFVAIPGLVERSFPPPPRQDPVLLDKERETFNAAFGTSLRTRERQALDAQFTFRHALGAASDAVLLSYPRLDSATGQIKVASHFLLRVAEERHGRPMDYVSFEKVVERIPIGRLDPGPVPLTPGERDLAAVTQAVESSDGTRLPELSGFQAIVRGSLSEAARWGERAFTEYDGMLGTSVTAPALMSPTQLETYGACPFRFFGQKVLGVRKIDEPESVETLSPLDRGSILHDILEMFLAGLKRDGWLPFDAARKHEYQQRLRDAAHKVFHDFEDGGAVGYPFMWVLEQQRILTDLEAFLSGELAESEGFIPQYFEARFGPIPEWARPGPGSIPDPLEISVQGKTLRFGGYVDRIDIHPAGVARVIDYKSGRNYGEKDNLFRGGKSLQLPLYLLATDKILQQHGQRAVTQEAQYYYITARGGFKRVVFTRDQFRARDVEFKTILATMAQGMNAGVFPQHPDAGRNCEFCEFVAVCGHGRVALTDRKMDDDAIEPLREMWEIE